MRWICLFLKNFDHVLYRLHIILRFFNLNCMRPLFILLKVRSIIVLWEPLIFNIISFNFFNVEVLKGFSFSFLSWLYFLLVEFFLLCLKVLVWCFFRSGLKSFPSDLSSVFNIFISNVLLLIFVGSHSAFSGWLRCKVDLLLTNFF